MMTTLQSSATASEANAQLRWGNDAVQVSFGWLADSPVFFAAVQVEGGEELPLYRTPAVEVLTAGAGHVPASGRLAHTEVGAGMRYAGHHETVQGARRTLLIRQEFEGIESVLELEVQDGISAIRTRVQVTNLGPRPVVLRAVSSLTAGFTIRDATDAMGGWARLTGVSEWLGEGRWSRELLRGPDFVPLAEGLTGHNPRGALVATSDGTWSTGHQLPTGVLSSRRAGLALAWQIEHNGAWRWEIGEDTDGGYLALSGPTDADSGWSRVLAASESFTTVPVTVAYGYDESDAVDALTAHRRRTRRDHPDNTAMPVIFNDYMNTLDGNPTTQKLLPLIAAAGAVGAEVFCIDAGWYDDSGHWWDSVGEWQPSVTRFPGGLGEVIDAIRAAGMVPGLWLEPEVVGVRSPLADRLPAEAFLQRNGQRIVEHHRYHLDLRHSDVRAHLDQVVDRLVAEFGIGFFKMDYNINPGPGTDLHADSVGDGLLGHNRAHLDWLDGVLDRHPTLVIENCSSGAMRMDYALLSRLAMQSTSDQQDYLKYPVIAASAPLSILPEQAASWAYPQPDMSEEAAAFCLVTGLLGRFYVSGHLNEMTSPQRARVADAIAVAKRLRGDIAHSTAYWPAGLPQWDDTWVSLGLRTPGGDLVSVWNRGEAGPVVLHFPHLRGSEVAVSTEFPADLPSWPTSWDVEAGTLTAHANGFGPAARTLRLVVRPNRSA